MKTQGGASLITILTSLTLVVVVFSCAVKLTPIYSADFTTKKLLHSFDESKQVKNASITEIQGWLARELWMNSMPSEIEKAVHAQRDGNKIILEINYERRVHLVYNIDAIITFKNSRTIY